MALNLKHSINEEEHKNLLLVWKQVFDSILKEKKDEWKILYDLEKYIIQLPTNQHRIYFIELLRDKIPNDFLTKHVNEFLLKWFKVRGDLIISELVFDEPDEYIEINPNVKNPKAFIKDLYKHLLDKEFISCEFETFQRHFAINDHEFRLIEWRKKESELYNLIYKLHYSELIIISNWVKTTSKHFRHFKKGLLLNFNSMEANRYKSQYSSKVCQTIVKKLLEKYLPKS